MWWFCPIQQPTSWMCRVTEIMLLSSQSGSSPWGGSLDECTHLWYHDVLWIKALSKMTLSHTLTHMFLAAAPPLPPFVCINRLKLLETNRPTSQEDGHMRGMKSITLLITAVTSHIETKRKKDLNHHEEDWAPPPWTSLSSALWAVLKSLGSPLSQVLSHSV